MLWRSRRRHCLKPGQPEPVKPATRHSEFDDLNTVLRRTVSGVAPWPVLDAQKNKSGSELGSRPCLLSNWVREQLDSARTTGRYAAVFLNL